ncbi:MAG: Universal stress protein UspA and related nucleotide-binding proteins, partial [uncultured Nocardioidaceae bacterium]
ARDRGDRRIEAVADRGEVPHDDGRPGARLRRLGDRGRQAAGRSRVRRRPQRHPDAVRRPTVRVVPGSRAARGAGHCGRPGGLGTEGAQAGAQRLAGQRDRQGRDAARRRPGRGGQRQPRHQRDGPARQHRSARAAVRALPRARRPSQAPQEAVGQEGL